MTNITWNDFKYKVDKYLDSKDKDGDIRIEYIHVAGNKILVELDNEGRGVEECLVIWSH